MMNKQFIAGFGLAALVLIGAVTFASWNGNTPNDNTNNTQSGLSQADLTRFIEAMRTKVVTEMGQPIEGFEPFMFMRVFPGLIAQDFNNVDALIGRYVVANGEVTYDLNGEQELHSAARAISDEGMEQIFLNILSRITLMAGSDQVDGVLEAIGASPGPDPTVTEGETTTITGTITCLPHKGDGPHTMECAFGLQATNGKHYALQNLWDVAPELTETQIAIRVTGVLSAPAANEKYDIVGVIKVTKAEKI
jgi:hypothetical protein